MQAANTIKQLQEIVHCGLQAILHLAVNSVCAITHAWGERREMVKTFWNIKTNKHIETKYAIYRDFGTEFKTRP